MADIDEAAPDAEAVLRMAEEGARLARDASARVSADLAEAAPAAVFNNLRGLVAALETAMADPAAADRVSRGAYHLAGLLDAAGLFPAAAVSIAADAMAAYASEPDQEG